MKEKENEPQKPSTRPAFSAPLWAAIRQGTKELSQILPAFPESVRVVEEPGMMGNPTQYEVNNQVGVGRDIDKLLDAYGARAHSGREQSQTKELER